MGKDLAVKDYIGLDDHLSSSTCTNGNVSKTKCWRIFVNVSCIEGCSKLFL